jgi:hypothetical protein
MSSGFENTKCKKNYTPSLSGSKGGYAKCHPSNQDLAQIYITVLTAIPVILSPIISLKLVLKIGELNINDYTFNRPQILKIMNFHINCSKIRQFLAVDSKCDIQIRLLIRKAL